MEITIDKFQDFLLYSNKNIEKLVSRVVNESSNASLVSLYEDAAILLDHKNGSFYKSKYEFNPQEGTIVFEDFEEINLKKDTSSFKDAVNNFFEGTLEVSDLAEAYQSFAADQESFIDSVVSESLSEKNFNDLIDYSPLEGINEEVDIKNESFFKEYKARLESNPMESIKMFDFVNPVKVSLVESESVKIVNKNVKERAKLLYKNSDFKSAVNEAFEALKEGNDEYLKVLAEDYSQIFSLDKAERKEIFAKATIGNANLLEGRTAMFNKAEKLFAEDENIIALCEAAEEEAPADTAADKEEDVPSELTPAEVDKLTAALEKALEKVEDEKLADKIEALIKALDDGKETGTDVETVKESVELLTL